MRNEYDFSDAKRAKDVAHLAQLQAEAKNKTVVTMLLDNDIFAALRSKADKEGVEYQSLINQTLRDAMLSH